jgi:hypothetical protein
MTLRKIEVTIVEMAPAVALHLNVRHLVERFQ